MKAPKPQPAAAPTAAAEATRLAGLQRERLERRRLERLRLKCLDRAVDSTARQLGEVYGTSTNQIVERARAFYLFVADAGEGRDGKTSKR